MPASSEVLYDRRTDQHYSFVTFEGREEEGLFEFGVELTHAEGAKRIGKDQVSVNVRSCRFLSIPDGAKNVTFLDFAPTELAARGDDDVRHMLTYDEWQALNFGVFVGQVLVNPSVKVHGWRMWTARGDTVLSQATARCVDAREGDGPVCLFKVRITLERMAGLAGMTTTTPVGDDGGGMQHQASQPPPPQAGGTAAQAAPAGGGVGGAAAAARAPTDAPRPHHQQHAQQQLVAGAAGGHAAPVPTAAAPQLLHHHAAYHQPPHHHAAQYHHPRAGDAAAPPDPGLPPRLGVQQQQLGVVKPPDDDAAAAVGTAPSAFAHLGGGPPLPGSGVISPGAPPHVPSVVAGPSPPPPGGGVPPPLLASDVVLDPQGGAVVSSRLDAAT